MRSHQSRHGFTLIELLVVISILALLIALLLPALAQTRVVARDMVCRQNARQISAAMLNYINTYEGWLPPSRVRDPGVAADWPEQRFWTNMLAGGDFIDAPDASKVGLTRNSIFFCPEGVLELDAWAPSTSESDGGHRHPNHSMGYYPFESGGSYDPTDGIAVPTWYSLNDDNQGSMVFPSVYGDKPFLNINEINRASALVMLGDGVALHHLSAPNRWSARHPPITNGGLEGNVNFSFFDGHVDGHNSEDLWGSAGLNRSNDTRADKEILFLKKDAT